MDGDYGLSDIRFSGFDNVGLAEQVDGLRNGPGSESLHDAMSALMTIGYSLAVTDVTLREQLVEIGVNWQGQSADGGTAATEAASIYAEDAIEPVTDSAQGVGDQGESYSNTRNGAPDSQTLRGPTEENGFDQFAGMLGHTTDHAREVGETNAAREQAVDSMTGYQNGSSDALNRSRALPVPPGMNLVAQPVDNQTGVTNVSGYSNSGVPNPTGAGTGPGSGGPSNVGLPPGGAPPPTTGPPGTSPITGPGPTTGLPSGTPPTTTGGLPPGLRPAINPLLMADAAGMVGAGGAGGAGAGAERDRLGRGVRPPGAPLKNGVPIGSVPDDEARAARNAERYGAKTGRPAGSIMQPAAGRRAEGEDDQEHVRRYGIDSGDVFEDDRVVAPESIGDEDD